MGQLKKNEYRKYFFAAVGVAIIVFACVGVIMLNYSITVKRELYETSLKNLNEVYTQVSEIHADNRAAVEPAWNDR